MATPSGLSNTVKPAGCGRSDSVARSSNVAAVTGVPTTPWQWLSASGTVLASSVSSEAFMFPS